MTTKSTAIANGPSASSSKQVLMGWEREVGMPNLKDNSFQIPSGLGNIVGWSSLNTSME